MTTDLGPGRNDRVAAALRSVASSVPFAGGLLVELITEFIPNQRIDRAERFLRMLADRLAALELTSDKLSIATTTSAVHIETAVQAAAEKEDPESHLALAAVVASRMQDHISDAQARVSLELVRETSPIDVAVLLSLDRGASSDLGFIEKFGRQAERVTVFIGADDQTRSRAAVRDFSLVKLEQLGLIEYEIENDEWAGRTRYKRKFSHVTDLGRMLLRAYGLRTGLDPNG